MVEIELTEEQVNAYNNNEEVVVYDSDVLRIAITRDTMKAYNYTPKLKKMACYLPNRKDVEEINSGNPYTFYYGKINLVLSNKNQIKLKEGLI